MIPGSTPVLQMPDWQTALAQAFRDPTELLGYLQLPSKLSAAALEAARDFPLLVPREYAALMEKGNPKDPLLLQVLPQAAEQEITPGFGHDPLSEAQASASPGLLQKYHGRALWIASSACPIHCRYCFRRHFPYQEHSPKASHWQQAVEKMRQENIEEVILSGGDPLSLSNRRLGELLHDLAKIPSLRRLRIHSRFPVILPSRIDQGFLQCLERFPLPAILVVHANHPNELGDGFAFAMQQLKKVGCHLYNQAVLLRHINDNPNTLAQLSDRLYGQGVQPYYLHQLDQVQGSAHFEVTLDQANWLYQSLLQRLPGYLIPRWVKEVPGKKNKVPLGIS